VGTAAGVAGRLLPETGFVAVAEVTWWADAVTGRTTCTAPLRTGGAPEGTAQPPPGYTLSLPVALRRRHVDVAGARACTAHGPGPILPAAALAVADPVACTRPGALVEAVAVPIRIACRDWQALSPSPLKAAAHTGPVAAAIATDAIRAVASVQGRTAALTPRTSVSSMSCPSAAVVASTPAIGPP
jgi:hypothetical protein